MDIAESRVVQMMGRLHVDLFLQDRFLLNEVSIKIRLMRSKDTLSLVACGASPDHKAHIVDTTMLMRKVKRLVLCCIDNDAHLPRGVRGRSTGARQTPPIEFRRGSVRQDLRQPVHLNRQGGTGRRELFDSLQLH